MPRPSVDKPSLIDLLRLLLGAQRGETLADVAARAGLALPTLRRQVGRLIHDGWIARPGDAGAAPGAEACFTPGATALAVAELVKSSFPLADLAMPHMRRLVEATGESVVLNVYDPGEDVAICVAVCESRDPLQYSLEVGEAKSLHAGASGKAILASLPPARRKIILSRPLKAVTDRTETDGGKVEQELDAVRAAGYVVSHGQRIPGAVGIAASLAVAQGIPASLVITIPEHRFNAAHQERLVAALVAEARRLEDALGTRAF